MSTLKKTLGCCLALVLGMAVWGFDQTAAANPSGISPHVHLRGNLQNSRLQFQRHKKGHVAFIGGSITAMNGYRPLVCNKLKKRFPETQFTFTDAGISSTCSTTGAFRLDRDVLSKGPVDLFFIEFAVNDDQDAAHPRQQCIRGMEGIIRRARRHNPHMDVVITYFVNPGMLERIQNGKTPVAIGSHDEVAGHYNISTIHLAQEVAQRIAAKKLTWKQYGGTHPAPLGHALCAGMIEQLLQRCWDERLSETTHKVAHPMPSQPLDPKNYGHGRFLDPQQARFDNGWKLQIPDWSGLTGQCRRRFVDVPLLCCSESQTHLTLPFNGTAIGAYVLAGPDAGIVEFRVDDNNFQPVGLYHRFSRGLHYPRTIMFAADLTPGKHLLQLRMAENKKGTGPRSTIRILQFVSNAATHRD